MMIESQIGFSTFLVSIREERYAVTRGLLNAGMTKALAECNNDVYKSLFGMLGLSWFAPLEQPPRPEEVAAEVSEKHNTATLPSASEGLSA